MDKKEKLLNWINKIEKKGMPKEGIVLVTWKDMIENIKKISNKSYEEIEKYVISLKETFQGKQVRAGPIAMQHVLNQISAKMWSINRQARKQK